MSKPELIEALPDLVLLVKRDGTPVAHAGGRAVPELGGADAANRERFVPAWSASTAALLRQLTRNAIADRTPVEARFHERDTRYEIRITPQGPDRAMCVIRPVLGGEGGDTGVASTGEHPQLKLDRRGFLRRFKESISVAALRERPLAVAVVYVDEIADIAEIILTRVSEQIMTTALSRLPLGSGPESSPEWY